MTNSNNEKQPANKPVFRTKLPGGISAAVFQNTRDDGKTYRSINLQRSYYHNGGWHRKSIFMDHQDIPFMKEALDAVWRFLNEFPITLATPGEDDTVESDVGENPKSELEALA